MGSAPTEFAEVIRFRFGGPVSASDGAVGRLTYVLSDPTARVITHVAVRLSGFPPKTYNLPVELVQDAQARGITLTMPLAEIARKAEPAPSGTVQISGATTVFSDSTRLGSLVQASAHRETGALWRLVVQRGFLSGEKLVPVDTAISVETRRLVVHLPADQLKNLTGYRDDAALIQEARDAIFNYPRLRIDLRGIQVLAADGELWLCGHISSDLNKRAAEDQVRDIQGVATVHNELVADTDLASDVANALAADPRTQGQYIGVYPDLGVVTLRGAVNGTAARDVATSTADAVPGVERVINELAVRPDATVLPNLASVTSDVERVPGGR
ncbi:MAG TPA: BON domain-containing protein [Ktedonobacterales bacterium]|jgi:osmotically-inducible protein OsmY